MAGLGAAAISKETAEKQLGQWVEQGKITSKEAQQMAVSLVEQGKDEFDNARHEFAKYFNDLLSKAKVAKMSDLEALEQRVNDLENELKHAKNNA